jgi:UDP-2,3-diacylglucosamine hydrolase
MSNLVNSVYFLSDLHFGVSSPDEERRKQELFVALMDEVAARASALYIVGDLFDFWFEYKHVIPRGYHDVLSALGRVAAAGIPVYYFLGNHDFAAGASFNKDLGLTMVPRDMVAVHDGKRFYLYHGDGLALHDTGYRILKKIIRNPFSLMLFRALHPGIGFALASFFSKKSRDYTSAKSYGERDGMVLFAGEKIAQGMDYVVMGHRHLPTLLPIADGMYVNPGDWMKHYSYAVFADGRMTIMTIADGVPQQLLPA